ncbi:MAG TPA: TRAP transporter substrate-binding protein [Burkholderiales bacterium]|jgi:TRAP-type mannitol/chloroaromatic compound transport system substrate-binding protein|nr:TRAP transporter substrate-binding protein [Burkholderiales bacterium]
MRLFVRSAVALAAAAAFTAGAQAQTTLKMQATWPASLTLYENFTFFAERVGKISGGSLKVETMPAGQVVPAFEVLDATHKKVLDGAHAWSGYWTGKSKTAILFTGGPGGTFGMDFIDAMGWMHHGGGIELANEFFQKELKLNLAWYPILPAGPQAFGWFKRPIKNLADFKGMKCRQTGLAAEVWQRLGMTTVNMPGGEIIPSAQRGVIDCAEWVGGVEDLRLGFQNVWKYHYTPGMHENVTIGEIVFNMDVWKGLSPTHQEIIKSAAGETFLIWWAKWQKQNAEALKELQEKHGVRILRTPPDVLIAFLKEWDKLAAEEGAKNPFFKKVHDSQRAYAAVVVPAKRFYFPPYSFAANYYFPEGGAKPAAAKKK